MDISKQIIIYGVGKRGRSLIELMDLCGISVGSVIDKNSALWGQAVGKHIIESPEILRNKEGQICITVGSFLDIADIRKMLTQSYGFQLNHEISYHRLIMYLYEKVDVKRLIDKEQIRYQDHTTIIFGCESGLGLGGIEEWTKGICSKFLEEGEYDSYILTDNGAYHIPKELDNHLLKVDIDSRQMFSLHNMKKILNCIISHLPCILVTSQPDQTLLAGKLLKDLFAGYVKVISGIRGGLSEINESYMDMRNCTDLYVCVNSAVRKDMMERGVLPEKIYTMLCPVECPETLKRDYALNHGSPIRIGFAGRLEKEEKRMDLMLKVLEILERMQVPYNIAFAGTGSYETKIREFAKENDCDSRIKLLGKIDKTAISDFWKEKDICINISDHEGRSRSTIEAMANGAVPVVTDTWGVHDDITDGENGFIVAVGDYEMMAERIGLLDRERTRLLEMGQKAHQELKKKCSMDDHYKFWQKMIQLVM